VVKNTFFAYSRKGQNEMNKFLKYQDGQDGKDEFVKLNENIK